MYVNINLRHTRFDPTMTSVLKMLNKYVHVSQPVGWTSVVGTYTKSNVKIIKEKKIQDQISKGSLDVVN